jgi:hypothetical protein
MDFLITTHEDLLSITSDMTELYFDCRFKGDLNNLPPWIKSIHFDIDSVFDKPIEFLPESLEVLILTPCKNHTIEEIMNLPKSLKHLELGTFNNKIDKNIFPENLKFLRLSNFNQPIENNIFPKGLKSLDLGHMFNHPIDKNIFPDTLEHLMIGDDFNQPIENNIFPENLKYLEFGFGFEHTIKPEFLPSTLIKLHTFEKQECDLFPSHGRL